MNGTLSNSIARIAFIPVKKCKMDWVKCSCNVDKKKKIIIPSMSNTRWD